MCSMTNSFCGYFALYVPLVICVSAQFIVTVALVTTLVEFSQENSTYLVRNKKPTKVASDQQKQWTHQEPMLE